jgi:hypothetical protein
VNTQHPFTLIEDQTIKDLVSDGLSLAPFMVDYTRPVVKIGNVIDDGVKAVSDVLDDVSTNYTYELNGNNLYGGFPFFNTKPKIVGE